MSRLKPSELLSLRLERELGIAVRRNPESTGGRSVYQREAGEYAWVAEGCDGRRYFGSETIGEGVKAARLHMIRVSSLVREAFEVQAFTD
jgi:hypothetical protein